MAKVLRESRATLRNLNSQPHCMGVGAQFWPTAQVVLCSFLVPSSREQTLPAPKERPVKSGSHGRCALQPATTSPAGCRKSEEACCHKPAAGCPRYPEHCGAHVLLKTGQPGSLPEIASRRPFRQAAGALPASCRAYPPPAGPPLSAPQ